MFDTDSFLHTTVEGTLATSIPPVPVNEYVATISRLESRTPKDSVIMDVYWSVDDDKAREITGMENPTVRQSVFLDITESGELDMAKGRNVQLGRLRDAVKQNGPEPWSPSMLLGQTARIKIEHRIVDGVTFADVKRVSEL